MAEAAESAASAGASKQANVKYGVYSQPGPFVGQTVKQVKDKLQSQWSIPSDAKAMKGKVQLDDSYTIQPNDSIEFHRQLGEKGNL